MKKSTRGFTLGETVIVVGVVSLVLGAVWVAVGSVSNANQISQGSQQVGEVAQNIRAAFMNSTGIPITAQIVSEGCNLKSLDTAQRRLFPASMRNCAGGNCIINTAASKTRGVDTFRVIAPGCATGTPATSFRIVLSGLTRAVCENLYVSGMSYKDTTMGISRVCASTGVGCSIGAGTVNRIACNNNGICGSCPPANLVGGVCTAVPAQISFTTGACQATTPTNEVYWEFNLRN